MKLIHEHLEAQVKHLVPPERDDFGDSEAVAVHQRDERTSSRA